jgi:hypothetical protein
MDIQKELNRLQREIAESLRIQAATDKAAISAQSMYEHALAEWEAQHPLLVTAKTNALEEKAQAKKRLDTLREEARNLLGNVFIEDLPEGFNQKREKIVKYDKQGFFKQAIQYFPHLLMLDEQAVETFFIAHAKEEKDGALILPERLKVLASVEVVFAPKVEISNATISKLVFENEAPEETEPLTMIVQVKPQPWTRPANFEALLTAPSREDLPIIQDFSPEGESLPVSKVFNEDGTWRNPAIGEEELLIEGAYESVPPTDKINF